MAERTRTFERFIEPSRHDAAGTIRNTKSYVRCVKKHQARHSNKSRFPAPAHSALLRKKERTTGARQKSCGIGQLIGYGLWQKVTGLSGYVYTTLQVYNF